MHHLSSLDPNTKLETTNTKLAAALAAVGIPLNKTVPVRVMTGDRGDSFCFFFESKSPCGNYETAELIKAWDDKEWHERHPEHPFAYLKVAFENQARLTDYVRKAAPTAVVEKNGKIAFLSRYSIDSMQQKIFRKLNQPR